jgi:hypothetical protein
MNQNLVFFYYILLWIFQFTQKHGLLMETATLREMNEPLVSPFPEYFYLQYKMLSAHNPGYTVTTFRIDLVATLPTLPFNTRL